MDFRTNPNSTLASKQLIASMGYVEIVDKSRLFYGKFLEKLHGVYHIMYCGNYFIKSQKYEGYRWEFFKFLHVKIYNCFFNKNIQLNNKKSDEYNITFLNFVLNAENILTVGDIQNFNAKNKKRKYNECGGIYSYPSIGGFGIQFIKVRNKDDHFVQFGPDINEIKSNFEKITKSQDELLRDHKHFFRSRFITVKFQFRHKVFFTPIHIEPEQMPTPKKKEKKKTRTKTKVNKK